MYVLLILGDRKMESQAKEKPATEVPGRPRIRRLSTFGMPCFDPVVFRDHPCFAVRLKDRGRREKPASKQSKQSNNSYLRSIG